MVGASLPNGPNWIMSYLLLAYFTTYSDADEHNREDDMGKLHPFHV